MTNAALGVRDQAATQPLQILVSYLQGRQVLLLLDNGEHLLGAAAQCLDPRASHRSAGRQHQLTSPTPLVQDWAKQWAVWEV